MKIDPLLTEAKRLFDLGFAVLWLHPKSKKPIRKRWTDPKPERWDALVKEYRPGMNFGVKLGKASRLFAGGYLANIDVDIKSGLAADRKAALAVVEKLCPGVVRGAPVVRTGYGLRFLVRTKEPFIGKTIARAATEARVYMPSSLPSAAQRQAVLDGKLTKDELDAGWRMRPSWEVETMSDGRQAVFPPSVHPETEDEYAYARPVATGDDIPLVDVSALGGGVLSAEGGIERSRTKPPSFTVVGDIDLHASPLPHTVVEMIIEGKGPDGRALDRSASMLGVSMAMIDAGFTRDEILTVLTDQSFALGETGYDHVPTEDRMRAGAWVDSYCLQKALKLKDAKAVFAAAPPLPVVDFELERMIGGEGGARRALLNFSGAAAIGGTLEDSGDIALFNTAAEDGDWAATLNKGKHGGLLATYRNAYLILRHDISEVLFRRNAFASRDLFGADAPWGEKAGDPVTDDSILAAKQWLSDKWKIDIAVSNLYEACGAIALANVFHPVRDELNALPEWDCEPRIDRWLIDHFGATVDPAFYVGDVLRKWMVGSIKRVFEPGAKFDFCPILEGSQGVGKSTFGKVLFGEEYFSDNLPPLYDKDAALNLQGKRCVEFSELASLRKAEIEITKGFISRQVDSVRPPYGRKMVDLKRQTVFLGSTNEGQYLTDRSGNRRFWPIHVGVCDIARLAYERDQLWAEAFFIYRNGLEPKLYLEGLSLAYAQEVQASKVVADLSDEMSERLYVWFEAEIARLKADEAATSRIDLFGYFKASDLFFTGGPLDDIRSDIRSWRAATVALRDPRCAPVGYQVKVARSNQSRGFCLAVR